VLSSDIPEAVAMGMGSSALITLAGGIAKDWTKSAMQKPDKTRAWRGMIVRQVADYALYARHSGRRRV
jgi:hypothetical protein